MNTTPVTSTSPRRREEWQIAPGWMERVRGNDGDGYQPGVAFVYGPDGRFVTQFSGERSSHKEPIQFPPGTILSVRVMTHSPDSVLLDETFQVLVTDHADDLAVACVGQEPVYVNDVIKRGTGHYYFGVQFEKARLVERS